MQSLLKILIYSTLCSPILCSFAKWKKYRGEGGYVAYGSLAQPAKWKWMAAILIEESKQYYQHCGGSLVSHQHIITAAHCLIRNGSLLSAKSIIVRLGQYDLRQKGQDFKVAYYVLHPKFNKNTFDNDIAVIKLVKKVKFNEDIAPIKLPKVDHDNKFEIENNTEIAFIAGWGRTSFNGEFNDDLLEAKLHIVPQSECSTAYESFANISAQHICAKALENAPNPSDACPGDSGGPLVQLDMQKEEYFLTGVISFGRKCGLKKVPGVYARVQYFSKWIKKVILKTKRLKRIFIIPVNVQVNISL